MRKIRFALVSTLAMTAGLSSAWAQTPAPETPPAATPPADMPPAATPPAVTPEMPEPAGPRVDEAAPAAVTPAEAAEETFPAAWFRIDSDLGSLQLWAGATHMISDSVGIATDMYVLATFGGGGLLSLGEFDIGPAITAGPVYVTPMIGLQADWGNHRAAALVPQLYVTGGPDPIYMELWLQNYAYTVFDKSGVTATGGGNYIYGRFFIDYKLGKYVAIGPEAEITFALNDLSKNAAGDSLTSLPVGLNLMLSNYGKNNNFFLFGGYETADTANDAHLAGRLTFVHNM